MKTGIYCIENTTNGKKYIGKATNYESRKRTHQYHLRKNTHYNKLLQIDYNNGGEFTFCLLKTCEVIELNDLEEHYILKYNTIDINKGYNVNIGHKPSKESILKGNATKRSKRIQWGEDNPNATITDVEAEKIMLKLLNGDTVSQLSTDLKVSKDTIYNLMYNKTYLHVLTNRRKELCDLNKKHVIDRDCEILKLYECGLSQNIISKQLKVSRNTIRKVLKQHDLVTNRHVNQFKIS